MHSAELYPAGAIDTKVVNLVEGENFAPSFLKLVCSWSITIAADGLNPASKNPDATLPTLEADGKVYTNTTDVIAYLVQNAPVKVKTGSSIIQTVHEDKYDPNFALLLSRNDNELSAKGGDLPGLFLAHREAALEKYSATPEAAPFKAFYDAKLAGNGGLLAIYQGKAPEEVKEGFFKQSQAHFANVTAFVFEVLPSHLTGSGFIGGEQPGEDDFHVGAWLTRIAATVGATSGDDALKAFEAAYGKPVPEKVAAYWNAWIVRSSWKKVYAEAHLFDKKMIVSKDGKL